MKTGIIESRIKNCYRNHGALLHLYVSMEKDLTMVYAELKTAFTVKIENHIRKGELGEVKKIKDMIEIYEKKKGQKDHSLVDLIKFLEKELKEPLVEKETLMRAV